MRRQLPVYSPLSLGAIVRAVGTAARAGDGGRNALTGALARRFGADRVVLTSSGTHALQLALSSVPARDGAPRIVALPGYSCYDVVTAAVGAGVRVRFYDLDPTTLTPDLDSLRRVVHEGVAAVVAANLYGYPLDWGPVAAECRSAGVTLIEDAAQGVGTRTDAGTGGSLGDATVLSFGRGKGWTGGGGGALLLRDDRLVAPEDLAAAGSLRPLVTTVAAWGLGRPAAYRLPSSIPALGLGETRYREPSRPLGLAAFCGALARATEEASRDAVTDRRERARKLTASLEGACRPVGGPDAAGFLRVAVLARDAACAETIAREGRDLGVARGYPVPLPDLPASAGIAETSKESLEGSRALAARAVTLPTHRFVSEADVAGVMALLKG